MMSIPFHLWSTHGRWAVCQYSCCTRIIHAVHRSCAAPFSAVAVIGSSAPLSTHFPGIEDYEKELHKPLKPPPPGLEWRRLDDGMWELRRRAPNEPDVVALAAAEASGCAEVPGEGIPVGPIPAKEMEDPPAEKVPEPQRMPEFLEHVIMPEDTMTGLCMRYKVKARELRQLNDFIGDHFRLCSTLIVPNRLFASSKSIQQLKPPTKSVLLQKFRNISYLDHAEARFYMEETGWDVDRALQMWRDDKDWEQEQEQKQEQQKASTQAPTPVSERGTKKRRLWGRSSSRRTGFAAISGTTNPDYIVAEDGSIELRDRSENFNEARVPLLSGMPMRFRTRR